jgi:PAS domain S-box-containing protein
MAGGEKTRSAPHRPARGRGDSTVSLAALRPRRAEASQAAAEPAFERVFEEALDVIALIDPSSGEIVRANRAVERCLGYNPARVAGRHFSILFPAEVWSTPEELVGEVRRRGAQLGEREFQRADGSILPMLLHVTLVPWGGGQMIVATLRDASERAQAEDALRRSAERLELVLRGADLGLWDWNVQTNEISFSARAAEIVGYAVDELAPDASVANALIHPDDRVRVSALMDAHLRGETPYFESEHRLRAKSGEWVWVLNRGKVVTRDEHERPLRATGTQFDISERKRSEQERAVLLEMAKELSGTIDLEELVASVEQRTAEVLPAEAVATIYWDTDREAYRLISQHGFAVDLADAARAMTFRLGAVFEGRLAARETLVVERAEDWGARERALLARFRIGALVAAPLVIRGQVRGAFVVASPSGRPFTLQQVRFLEAIARQLAIAIETSALYRAQQAETHYSSALARVGQELISSVATPAVYGDLCRVTTAVLDCEVSATFLWSAWDGAYSAAASHGDTAEGWEALRVVRLTSAMANTLLATLAPTGLVRLADLPADDAVRRALAGAHGLIDAIVVALRRGTEIIGFHCAGRRGREAFTRHHERIARGIAQIGSIALENARLVEELERAGRIKSDFVATMSHELRTPLNVIIGYHDLLLEGEFGDLTAAQAERLRRADQSARELLDLINATLDLSRLEARRMPLQVHDVDLAAMVQELDADLATVRQKPGVRFAWQFSGPPPPLRTDPVKLKVVLKNLIHNAIKFTDAGEVTVSVWATPGRVEFEVADTGIGIGPELLGAIFEPFRQADSSSTRSYGGVGLGLYIVRRLLDLLGGSIGVESELGRGSRFRFWVPAE